MVVHVFFCCKTSFFVGSNDECDTFLVKMIFSKFTGDVAQRLTADYREGKQII